MTKNSGKGFNIAVVVGALAVGFLLVAALMRGYGSGSPVANTAAAPDAAPQVAQQQSKRDDEPASRATPEAAAKGEDSSVTRLFGGGTTPPQQDERHDWLMTFANATVRLTLAALLSALLAFRPRRFSRSVKRNPFVAQTQILLAVVASALMMIVGDSTARAFGIFAAASLVRFRTNIKDPKEITVLLLSLAIGLSTGVGRWELGLVFTFFVLLLLWGLEYREPEMVTRSMELTVKTRNVGTTQDALLELFRRYDFPAELRTINRPDAEDPMGCVVYYLDVSPQASTDRMSEELLGADSKNIDSIEWDQQKNTSYFYQ
ncbi:MAG: hypothetical protein QOJ70_2858 [Acidobacteriota bacterium]|jgi:uncharacterized membrane protein YhiD involved in acid resistance|nr:hypothetical protein [Acidobacteriota bacterium]